MVLKQKISRILRWSEKYLKTDMTYVARGGFWIIAGKAGMFASSLLVMAAFSNFASREVFGTYQYVTSLAAVLAFFTLPGMNAALVRSVARKKEGTLLLALKEKLRFSVIGSALLFGISAWYLLRGNMEIGFSVLAAGVFFPFYKTFNLFENYWQGKQDFKKRAEYTVLSAALSAVILASVIYFTGNPLFIISAFFLSHSVLDGIFLKKTAARAENSEADDSSVSYGKHLSLMGLANSIAQHIDRIILWRLFGPAEVAIYSFSYIPVSRAMQLCPVSTLSLPKLSEKDVKGIKRGIISKFTKLFLAIIPFAALLYFFAPFIYSTVFPGYEASVPYFRVLLFLLLLMPFQLLKSALIAEKKQKALYITNISVPAVRILLFFILAPVFQIWGMVYALLGSSVLSCAMSLYFFLKI